MGKFTTIDDRELLEIDGGEAYDMDELFQGVSGKISEWFKDLFD